MSKSKGNVVTPMHLLDQYGADAVRYWSLAARLGTDTAFDEKVFAVGRRLVMKLYNASKYALSQSADEGPVARTRSTSPSWRGSARRSRARRALLDELDYAGALDAVERFFWSGYTDNYLELVKARARSETDAGGPRLGGGRGPAGPERPAAPVRAVPALRHRGGLVVGLRGGDRAPQHPPRAVAAAAEFARRATPTPRRARLRRRLRLPRRGAPRQERRRRHGRAPARDAARRRDPYDGRAPRARASPTCARRRARRATCSRRERAWRPGRSR